MINKKYKDKYKRIKRIIRNYVYENAALCDQISQIQENINVVKEERCFLLRKLIEHENDGENYMAHQIDHSEGSSGVIRKRTAKNKRSNSDASAQSISKVNSKPRKEKKQSKQPLNQQITPITLDSQGRPVYPINLGNLKILSVGEILPGNLNFHNEHWIYPVGYTSTRVYSHPKTRKKSVFTCKILDNLGTPQFQIIPDSDFDHVFFGKTADVCHKDLLDTILSGNKNLSLRPQGDLFFGLGHPTTISLLSVMPSSQKCANFKGFFFDGMEKENDPTLNFDALQTIIANSAYHTVPEIKEEPPDDLLE